MLCAVSRWVTGTLAITLLALGVSTAEAGKKDDTLRAAMSEEILNLDYNYTTKREYIILSMLTDGTLFQLDPQTQEILPSIATKYSFPDDKTVDVTLRDDVVFHDGTPLKAEDVVYTYNWIASEDSKSHAGPIIRRWLKSVEQTGPNTVRFTLKSPYPLVLRDMAQRVMIRKKDSYLKDGKPNPDAMASNLIGAGPYQVVSFRPGQELVLKRFDRYYGKKPEIANIVIRNLPDIGTQQAELMAGGIDWMFKVPLDMAKSLDPLPNIVHLSGPDLRVAFIVIDAGGYTDPNGPLTKLAVRQAMNHAINKKEISQYLMGGSAKPIHTPCHPSQFGCRQDVANYTYDPKKAKELLAQAGYPNGFNLQLWAYRDRPIAEAVMADLKAVGINVDLRYVKLESLNQARKKREIPAYIGTWGSSGIADTALIARVHFSNSSDRYMAKDNEVVQNVAAAEATSDQAKRKAHYSQAIKRIVDQAYWVPLSTYSANFLVSSELDFPVYDDGLPRLQNSRWK